jgi:hypothetical protein
MTTVLMYAASPQFTTEYLTHKESYYWNINEFTDLLYTNMLFC